MEWILSVFYKAPTAILPVVALVQIAVAIGDLKNTAGGIAIAGSIFTFVSGSIHGYMGGLLIAGLYDLHLFVCALVSFIINIVVLIIVKDHDVVIPLPDPTGTLSYIFVCVYIAMIVTGLGFMVGTRKGRHQIQTTQYGSL